MQTDREDVALEKALELSKAILFRKVIKIVLAKYESNETLLMYEFSNDFVRKIDENVTAYK